MLKLVQVQARLDIKNGQATIRQMSPQNESDYKLAQEIIELHQTAIGQTQNELDAKIAVFSGARLDYREIDGMCKVIADTFATFQPDTLPFTEKLIPQVMGEGFDLDTEDEDELEEKEDFSGDLASNNRQSSIQNRGLAPFLGQSYWRLAVWKEAAKPGVYPFANPELLAQVMEEGLERGAKMRRSAGSSSAFSLTGDWLIPPEKRLALLEKAAEDCGYLWDKTATLPPQPEKLLFSDLPSRYRLISLTEDLTVENLLNRYNVELLRGVLYLAPRVKIVVRDRYKDLFKYIKFFGLMHTITPIWSKRQNKPLENGQKNLTPGDLTAIEGYQIILEGASSPFLARTDRRYGLRFAQFLPAMLLCEAEWQLEAELTLGDNPLAKNATATYRLGPQPHLKTHFKGSGLYDSQLEESLAAQFERRFNQTSKGKSLTEEPMVGEDSALDETQPQKKKKAKKVDPRKGWSISREDRLIPVYDTVMIPDFAFENVDGRRAMLEVVGFWEKSYLERKIAKLNKAGRTDIIVLVSERTRCGSQHFKATAPNGEVVYQLLFFKGTPRLGPILEALERCAVIEKDE